MTKLEKKETTDLILSDEELSQFFIDIPKDAQKISKIILVKENSNQCKDRNADLKAGDFYIWATDQILGPVVNFSVIDHREEWMKKLDDDTILSSTDGEYWDNGDEIGDEAYKYRRNKFLVCIKIDGEFSSVPVELTIKGANWKSGRSLLSFIANERQNKRVPFQRCYELTAMKNQDKNAKYDGLVYQINPRDLLEKDDLKTVLDVAKEYKKYNSIKTETLGDIEIEE